MYLEDKDGSLVSTGSDVFWKGRLYLVVAMEDVNRTVLLTQYPGEETVWAPVEEVRQAIPSRRLTSK